MSRFFFDSYEDGQPSEDRDGVEFADSAAAEKAAVQALVSIARESFAPSDRAMEMVVRNGEGKAILACTLSLTVRRPA
jgi:hypothetical protein